VTEEAEDFAFADFEADVIQSKAAGGPALGEMSDFEESHGV
jgi:hypothetical protein